MKLYKFFTICLALIFFSACESELDIVPESELTYNGFWDTEEAARAAQVGLYANFRARNGVFWEMGEVRSDIWGGPTLETPRNLNMIRHNISATQVPFGNWAGFYGYIHHINDFLANIDGVSFRNENEKQHMIGQVYGLRAFMYFTMLKTWGKVPISTEPLLSINPEELARERSPRETVMQLVKDDLRKSLDAFGDDNSFWNGKRTYWSRAASLVLKGEVYIWSGNLLGGGQPDFTEAKQALEEVRGMNFSLVENFDDLWGENNENNNEFIFQIDYTRDEAGNFYNGNFTGRATEINATFDDKGNSLADFIANGYSGYGPTIETLYEIDDLEDDRRDATFLRLYDNPNGARPFEEEGYLASILTKFLGSVDAGSRLSFNDVPIYRYADVLLLLAEVKNHLGEDPSEEINLIRERAYGDNYNEIEHAYTGGSQDENTRAILNERLKEFIGEGKRWFDLRRAGAEYVFDYIEYLDASEAFKLELPITTDMIANNPLLEQTEGYE